MARQQRMQIACAALLLATAGLVCAEERYIEDTDRFPGWKGELPQDGGGGGGGGSGSGATTSTSNGGSTSSNSMALADSAGQVVTVGYGEKGEELWRGQAVQVSWSPRVFLFRNFLSDEECDHLIGKAKPQMTKSTVVDNETGKSVDSTVRTSTGTFFARAEDEVIDRIEKRIAMVTHIPQENGEGMQVLHYVDGQKYEPHHDFFHDKYNARAENGGQRIATVLMYLTTVEEGGETVFPNSPDKVTGPEWSECARQGLAVKTRRGDAMLFFSLLPSGEPDPMSMHGSCPTTKGEKWSATKWIHVGPFGVSAAMQKAKWGDCIDGDERCGEWAASGECKKNPAYMLTSCRLSCKQCTPKSTSKSLRSRLLHW